MLIFLLQNVFKKLDHDTETLTPHVCTMLIDVSLFFKYTLQPYHTHHSYTITVGNTENVKNKIVLVRLDQVNVQILHVVEG